MATAVQKYVSSGVTVSKSTIYVGDEISLTYDGLLVGSGANNIVAHIGYNDTWEDKAFIPMENINGIFSAKLVVSKQGTLNVAFKDSADNWDNNSFENYSFKISAKKTTKAEAEKVIKMAQDTAKTPASKASGKTTKKTTSKT